jgi:hypothetical protein
MVVVEDAVEIAPASTPWSEMAPAEHREKTAQSQNFGITHLATGYHVVCNYSRTLKGGWSPRHHHVHSQIRFILKGHPYYDGKKYGPGDLMYVPESVYYGPHTRPEDDVEMLAFQFGGESGTVPKFTAEQYQAAKKELQSEGVVFKDGIANWPNGTKQDASEAIHERMAGYGMRYAPPRFEDPVQIHSANFPWRPSRVPGVAYKHLAYFNECGPNVTLLKLEPGAATPPGKVGCIEIRLVVAGEAEYAGQRLEAVSRLYFPPEVPFEEMRSPSGAEVLVWQMALQGGEPPPLHVV